MSIRVIGINHKTAPVSIREQVAFSPDGLNDILKSINEDITANNNNDEVVILSTCNRTEIYTSSDYSLDKICSWMCHQNKLSKDDVQKHLYDYSDETAIQHIMRVASGLDSLVLGEPQILGQLKSALKTSRQQRRASYLVLVDHFSLFHQQ